jgi:hypothetical protein
MYVARPELGLKHQCVRCAVRFYDLRRVPAQCPACALEQPPPAPRTRAVPRAASARWQGRGAPRPGPGQEAVAEVVDKGAVPLLDAADPAEDDDEEVDDEVVVPDDEEEERG